ncbi:MAG TPA: hypothetical protein VFP39_13300 [Gemmatimonadales bacterium]|nr:hypothetical protein [Gemmatimonadales bacterium]
MSAPNDRIVWVSGHAAAVLRSTDGGATWTSFVVPGAAADSLQFRDVFAADATTAYLLAAGPGSRSRIYQTTDGGRNWQLQFTNPDSSAFYDCFDFWDARRGVALSDGVGGHLLIRRTTDGGAHWDLPPADSLPRAQKGEGGFAASGTCIVTLAGHFAWIGTGAADTARVLTSEDGGRSWRATATPIAAGNFAGIATVAFRDTLHGLVLGGKLGSPAEFSDNVAVSGDGGRTWRLAGRPGFSGAVYGAAVIPGRAGSVVAVGPRGLAYSGDDGSTWTTLDTLAYWSVGFASRRIGWAVGPAGRITRIRFP